jgi:hypothetical protein
MNDLLIAVPKRVTLGTWPSRSRSRSSPRSRCSSTQVGVPRSVTIGMIGDVLRRTWTLDEDMAQPAVETGPGSHAYVAEVDPATVDDPLFLRPAEREELARRLGDHHPFSVRSTSPALGQDMARAIAASELAASPMLVDLWDRFLTPAESLSQTATD